MTRFCPAELEHETGVRELIHWLKPGHPHYMGKRVAQARHLGELLGEPEPHPAPDRQALIEWSAARARPALISLRGSGQRRRLRQARERRAQIVL